MKTGVVASSVVPIASLSAHVHQQFSTTSLWSQLLIRSSLDGGKKQRFGSSIIGGGSKRGAAGDPLSRVGIAEDQGRRPYMEDRHVVCRDLGGHKGINLYGVFDGHGGHQAADFCVDRLPNILSKEKDFPKNLQRALVSSFLKVDDEFVNETRSSGSDDGTTAVVALIVDGNGNGNGNSTIFVANAGDSRALLIQRGGKFEPLSSDHKPNRPDETQRIKAAGGNIYFNGVWRVSGILAVSRAIGDRLLKPYVTARPEVTTWNVSKDDEILILATDGVWDVLTNENIASLIARLDPHDMQTAADMIASNAVAAGSTDNVTVIVIDLRPSHDHSNEHSLGKEDAASKGGNIDISSGVRSSVSQSSLTTTMLTSPSHNSESKDSLAASITKTGIEGNNTNQASLSSSSSSSSSSLSSSLSSMLDNGNEVGNGVIGAATLPVQVIETITNLSQHLGSGGSFKTE
jgi:protein phosphatase 1L